MRRLEPDLHVICAPNPSPMTGDGTNTYILGHKDLCVIDPGPDDDSHLSCLLDHVQSHGSLRMILVTHSHLDHSPLARKLAEQTGAAILAFGDSLAGRSRQMEVLARSGLAGGGEGVDATFRPDRTLGDGSSIPLAQEQIRAIWTPGHFGNHLCFAWRGAIFSGDHVMGWSSTFVSPPDGDLGAYMRSLDKLAAQTPRRLYPGHGAPVDDPDARIAELRSHRLMREHAILSELTQGAHTIPQLVAKIYTEIPDTLHHAAGRNVYAHLLDLHQRGLVKSHPTPCPDAVFMLAENGC
nr:MBL fold metallo-hydrolase [Roseinatronobacter thiooxidans]